ncbi:MAG: VCBS repeat-containing protein [Opitutae bacterium]|nr:VCBS repeat-containing protein [Opitutae bacterium]
MILPPALRPLWSKLRFLGVVACVAWLVPVAAFAAAPLPFQPGARVLVDKAGAGHRAIILKAEATRCYVAYEGADEQFDEWVELGRIRSPRQSAEAAPAPAPPAGATTSAAATAAVPVETIQAATPVPEPLPHTLDLPRQQPGADTVEVWLEQLPRTKDNESVRFNAAVLAAPKFKFGAVAGLATAKAPLQAVLLYGQNGKVRGFAALEDGVTLYRADGAGGFTRSGQLGLAALETFAPEYLQAGDLNGDGETDLVVVGGPVAQVYFGTADGRYVPSAAPYRAKVPLRQPAVGRFFAGSVPWGLAVVEGENVFRLLGAAPTGVTPVGTPYEVKFDRIVALVAGDFDGDGFSDLAISTESSGRSTGAWMYFNQRGATKPFLWPIGGKDDFARDLLATDLDHDGRCDLIMTDSDVDRGERIRVVYGAAGRAGWEDPWELIGSEYGVGFGTASIVVGDFNADGRTDIGIAGRNGLRLYLGADYRRFGRNPVWPHIGKGDFPEQRAFLAADLDGDGRTDLIGYTPVFATGYNVVLNDSTANPPAVHVPAVVKTKAPTQASTTVTKVELVAGDHPPGVPTIHHLASRAEPYGLYRYRIVVEVAVLADGVVQAVEGTCKYEGANTPLEEVRATSSRQGDQIWFLEVILPRGRTYDFNVTAYDDKGRKSDPLRITVNP